MAILIVLFLISLFLGPMLNNCCGKFGATMASVAHGAAVVGLLAFFELLVSTSPSLSHHSLSSQMLTSSSTAFFSSFLQWFLESWNASHAILGVLACVSIQRALYKLLISAFLSREFKHDETNRAWWTGVWYNRGLGSGVMSQPAREFIVKLVEMGLFAADCESSRPRRTDFASNQS